MQARAMLALLGLACLLVRQCKAAPAVSLAFGVMTYQKEGRSADSTYADFRRLMDVLYGGPEKHVYVLHVDVKSETRLLDAIHGDYCDPKPNCGYIEPRNIAWAGLTTGEMMLALMHRALEFHGGQAEDAAWDYFVLIGHESVPLYPLSYMEQYLAAFDASKKTNFMNCWAVEGYDFFGQWESNNYRLQEVAVDDFEGSLLEDLTPWQRSIPRDLRFFKSIQLVVVSRDYVKFACRGQTTRRILLYLANVKTSDEMLLPTILQSSPDLAPTATCDTTLHFTHWIRPGGSWHPEYLSLEHLPLLLNITRHLFARKFELPGRSSVLLQAVEAVREATEVKESGEGFNAIEALHTPPMRRPKVLKALAAFLPSVTRDHFLAVLDDPSEPESRKAIATAGLLGVEAASDLARLEGGHRVAEAVSKALTALDSLRAEFDRIESQRFIDWWQEQQQQHQEEQPQQQQQQEEEQQQEHQGNEL